MNNRNSNNLFERAKELIPGGVNSPVRAFKSVGGQPLFIRRAEGAYLYDEDDNHYIDLINSWGPMIMGHAWPAVTDALKEQLQHSLSYGAPTALEIEMAELVTAMNPGVEMIRMVNSGTEACMSAIRVARGVTGKNKFIKFEGCYHGHADAFLVSAGSGVATLGIQSVPGVTTGSSSDTLIAPFNDIDAVERLVRSYAGEIAAIILEPVAGNMGCIQPAAGFLQSLRTICDRDNLLLIFDEVMTGFRLAPGGAQEKCNVEADLVTYGKIIGGGLPVGAYGGKSKWMQHVAPSGNIYQAGTLSGNPLCMRAGLTMLRALKNNPSIYQHIDSMTEKLATGLKSIAQERATPLQVNYCGSMISLHFSPTPVTDYASAARADTNLFSRYFHFCLANGIYLPPSPFETWFISHAIEENHVDHILETTATFMKGL